MTLSSLVLDGAGGSGQKGYEACSSVGGSTLLAHLAPPTIRCEAARRRDGACSAGLMMQSTTQLLYDRHVRT